MAALVIRPLASLTHPRGVRKGLSRKFLGICFFAGVLIVLGTPRRLSPPLSISPQPQCIRSFWVRNRGNVGVTSKRDLKRCFRRCLVMGGSDEGFGQGMRGGFGGNEARLLVVCGPSGVGKGTLMERLRGRFGDKVAVAVSHTTREPRQGECNGVEYHFVSVKAFNKKIQENGFVEFENIHNHLYGTSKDAINQASEGERVCVLEVDVKGAQSIKNNKFNAKYVYITLTGGLETLEKRLRARASESQEKIKIRMDVPFILTLTPPQGQLYTISIESMITLILTLSELSKTRVLKC
ncbi:hypothetical protein AAMO2058_000539600 [Amorphochlora amoebiformis]